MTQPKGPSREAIQSFLNEVDPAAAGRGLKNGWHQFSACPICGSDTGAAMLVEPSPGQGQAWPGHFTCLSAKHPAGQSSLSFNRLMRALGRAAEPLASFGPGGRLARLAPEGRVAKPLEPEALKLPKGKLEEARQRLLEDDKAVAWLKAKFGLEQADVMAHCLGSDAKAPGGPGRLQIPYFMHGRPVMIKSRALYVDSGKEREFRRWPGGDKMRGEPVYGIDDLLDLIESGRDEDVIVVVEGESDRWTLKRLFPVGAYVVSCSGAKNIPPLLCYYLAQIEKTGLPRVCVVPDRDDSEGDNCLVTEIARRLGGGKVQYCEIPESDHYKDLTGFVMHEGLGRDEVLAWMREESKPFNAGRAVSLSTIIKRSRDIQLNTEKGLRFHTPLRDELISREGKTHPHLEPGVSLLCGPSGHGKSTDILRCAILSAKDGVPGCYDSSDQSEGAISDYVTRILTNMNPGDPKAKESAYRQSIQFENSSLYVLDCGHQYPFEEWPNFVRDGVATYGWKFVIVDNLTSRCGIGADASARAHEWAMMCMGLAAELGIHIMLMAHVGKMENNPLYWKRIGKNDIYYYKSITVIVDALFFFQVKERPGVTDDSPEYGRGVLFSSGKFRGKHKPPVQLLWNKEWTDLVELEGAFTNNRDIDINGISDEDVARRFGISIPKGKRGS